MERYRVKFADNKAVAASKIEWDTDETVKVNRDGNKKILEWFIVYGDNEGDAMQVANTVVNESLLRFLH